VCTCVYRCVAQTPYCPGLSRRGATRSNLEWNTMNVRLYTNPEPDGSHNRFGVRAGQSLQEWEKAGWIWDGDPRGWAQWYLRFYYGRRCPDDDRQVRRCESSRQAVKCCSLGCRAESRWSDWSVQKSSDEESPSVRRPRGARRRGYRSSGQAVPLAMGLRAHPE